MKRAVTAKGRQARTASRQPGTTATRRSLTSRIGGSQYLPL
ncbi:MAG: hypothetical protein DIU56_000230 [Pseudomonadota bacterium]